VKLNELIYCSHQYDSCMNIRLTEMKLLQPAGNLKVALILDHVIPPLLSLLLSITHESRYHEIPVFIGLSVYAQ